MLERAASSLDLCGAHRILYRSGRRAHPRTGLHPGFWRHGAAALEAEALQRTRAPTEQGSIRRSKCPSSRYSALESLYLSRTIPLSTARLSLFSPDLQQPFPSPIRPRFITTSATPRLSTATLGTTVLHHDVRSSAASQITRRHLSSGKPGDNGPPRLKDSQRLNRLQHFKRKRRQDLKLAKTDPNNPAVKIRALMQQENGDKFADQVWQIWTEKIPPKQKTFLQPRVVRYLRRISRGEVDVRRCWDIIGRAPRRLLVRRHAADAAWCTVRLGMHARAAQLLKLALDEDESRGRHLQDPQNSPSMLSFMEMLRFSFESSSWPVFRNACYTWGTSQFSEVPPSLRFLQSLPGVADVTLKFWQQLQDEGIVPKKDDALAGEATTAPDRSSSGGPGSDATLRAGAVGEAIPGQEQESAQRSLETTPPTAEFDAAAKKDSHDPSAFATRLLVNAAGHALLQSCDPDLAMAILHAMSYPELYGLYFEHMASKGTTHHLPRLFDECKGMAALEQDPQILRIMFDVYYPHNPDGLLDVHRLFCRSHYEGGEGSPMDPAELRDWWTGYAIRGVLSNYSRDPLVFLPYVEESKRRGDSDTEQFAMNLVMRELRFEERDIPWFADLKGYAERLDYEGAMEVWYPRFNSNKPDKVTLVTLLRVATERGDVAFAMGLFDKARLWGLARNPAVLIPVIRAFGMYRSPEEAAKICNWALENGAGTTEVFNTMLEVYASHNRLHELRGLMTVMVENSIAWDQQTYMHLMKALGRTKRGFDAHGLLNKASDLGIEGLTLDHFETVMAGALKMGVYSMVYLSARRMREEGLPVTLNSMSLQVKAAHRWRQVEKQHPVPPAVESQLKTGKDLVQLYRQTAEADTEAMRRGGKPGPSRDSLTVKRAAFTLAEVGDAESLEEFASIYLDALGHEHIDRHLPSGMITAFMMVEFDRGDYERVKALWRVLWDRHRWSAQEEKAGVEASYRTAPKVHPKLQYGLDEGFRIIQQVLALEGDADGLVKMIFDITSLGCELGQRSWNHAIQALVTMGRWKDAFKFNEQMLMPNWTGWRHFRRFKNVRRRQTAWDNHAALLEEKELEEAGAHKMLPEDDPSLSPEDRQFEVDHRLVSEFLRHQYNLRKKSRMQKGRKLKGTSINLAPRIRDPGRNPRYLRPNSHTLQQLARAYFEMEEKNAWFGNAQEWLAMFCPVSSLAVWTLRYADQLEMGGRTWAQEGPDHHGHAKTLDGPEEWDDAHDGAEAPVGAVGQDGDTEEPHRAVEGRAEATGDTSKQKTTHFGWRQGCLPDYMRSAIKNVLENGPQKKKKRLAKVNRQRRRARQALEQDEMEMMSLQEREEREVEEREQERAEWMRQAGIVDIEELKDEPWMKEDALGDEAGEKSEKEKSEDEEGEEKEEQEEEDDDEEEEIEYFERNARLRRHTKNRGRKTRYD